VCVCVCVFKCTPQRACAHVPSRAAALASVDPSHTAVRAAACLSMCLCHPLPFAACTLLARTCEHSAQECEHRGVAPYGCCALVQSVLSTSGWPPRGPFRLLAPCAPLLAHPNLSWRPPPSMPTAAPIPPRLLIISPPVSPARCLCCSSRLLRTHSPAALVPASLCPSA